MPTGRRITGLFTTLSAQPDLATTRKMDLPRWPGALAALERLQQPDEGRSATIRRLLADDLWRCPGGDIADRALLLFLPSRERAEAGTIHYAVTEDMYDLLRLRAQAIGLAQRVYVATVISRADILLGHGVVIRDDPEDHERAIAGMDIRY